MESHWMIKRKLGAINSSVQAEIEIKIRQLFGWE